jgi:CHAT domain-containing protein
MKSKSLKIASKTAITLIEATAVSLALNSSLLVSQTLAQTTNIAQVDTERLLDVLDVLLEKTDEEIDKDRRYQEKQRNLQDRLWRQPLPQNPTEKKTIADQLFQQGNEYYIESFGRKLNRSGRKAQYFEIALRSWHRALTIYQELQDRQGEEKVLFKLGIVHDENDEPAKAIKYFQQLALLYQESKNREMEGRIFAFLGDAYNDLPESKNRGYSEAIEYSQKALVIAREFRNRSWEADALFNLATAYHNRGDSTSEIEYLKLTLEIYQELKNSPSQANILAQLGTAYDQLGNYDKAVESFEQRLALIRQSNNKSQEEETLTWLGASLYKAGNLTVAETTLRDALKVWDSQRSLFGVTEAGDNAKVEIFEKQGITYSFLQKVLIAQKKTDAALEIAERGRSRSLVEWLLLSKSYLAERRTPPIKSPTTEQIKQIAKAHNSTFVLYSVIENTFQPRGNERKSELYIWLIKPTGEVAFRQVNLQQFLQQKNYSSLEDLVADSLITIGARGRGGIKVVPLANAKQPERLKQLHELLIAPITDLLPTNPNDSIVFVPQTSLFLVPFAALQDEEGKYLIEKHTILTSPSIQVLDLTKRNRQLQMSHRKNGEEINEYLVVGNPTMPAILPTMPSLGEKPSEKPVQLDSLPNAETEARKISSFFNTQALVGKDATKLAVLQKMASARIIHLATHGILDENNPLLNAIALAPLNNNRAFTSEENYNLSLQLFTSIKDSSLQSSFYGKDSGFLTANEIRGISLLNAELVVLSACDTGRGKITGDGVIGLSRAFIQANVPSVIVSLWSVPDAPTADLMVEFYRQWQQGQDKAQALRQAMLKTMEQHPNPRDWAAFTIIGEAN